MFRHVEEKYVYTHTSMCIMCTLRTGTEGMWVCLGGGGVTVRKCSTLLTDTQETLRYYLRLIFFCYTAGTYSEIFGVHNNAGFPCAAKTYVTASHGTPVIHAWVQYVWGVLFKDLNSPHYTSQR
jgi:hypothetical protein